MEEELLIPVTEISCRVFVIDKKDYEKYKTLVEKYKERWDFLTQLKNGNYVFGV